MTNNKKYQILYTLKLINYYKKSEFNLVPVFTDIDLSDRDCM